MTNKQIARLLHETAALIELTGGNAFRARAFSSAARQIERLEESAADRLQAGTLTQIEGIGRGLTAQIEEMVKHGSFELRDALLADLPPGLPEVLQVKGLGTKRVRTLWQELGITSLAELEQAAVNGQLATLNGFGKKTQENVLHNVRLLKQYSHRRRYADAVLNVQPVLEALRAVDGVTRVEVAGALRRNLETVAAVKLVMADGRPESVPRALAPWLNGEAPTAEEDRLVFSGSLSDGLPLEVHWVPEAQFGTLWWRLTGSDAHCHTFEAAYGAPEAHADEATLYAAAGLPYVPPELREGQGELEAAAKGTLPKTLIRVDDLQGSLHNHSTYSDGAHTLREMAEAARGMGLSYFGVCDHSRSLTIANGLSIERVRAQQAEIQELNDTLASDDAPSFRIFNGTECDILQDGSLDYPDEVLASFDFVVASVHTGFNMTADEATARIVRAIENPYTTILGHATGRLLLRREGYPIHHEQVIAACAEHGVAIELNANPRRLDMDWRWIREAVRQSVLIAINPDAHSTEELHYVRWGVAVARKGWLTPDQCLNAKSLDAFTAWISQRRTAANV